MADREKKTTHTNELVGLAASLPVRECKQAQKKTEKMAIANLESLQNQAAAVPAQQKWPRIKLNVLAKSGKKPRWAEYPMSKCIHCVVCSHGVALIVWKHGWHSRIVVLCPWKMPAACHTIHSLCDDHFAVLQMCQDCTVISLSFPSQYLEEFRFLLFLHFSSKEKEEKERKEWQCQLWRRRRRRKSRENWGQQAKMRRRKKKSHSSS